LQDVVLLGNASPRNSVSFLGGCGETGVSRTVVLKPEFGNEIVNEIVIAACRLADLCQAASGENLGFLARRFPLVGPVLVLLLEFLHAAGRIHELHFAGEERVARRADFDVDVFLGAARLKLVATAADHVGFIILGVTVFFHDVGLGFRFLLGRKSIVAENPASGQGARLPSPGSFFAFLGGIKGIGLYRIG
jgi:hypothetical protein